MKYHNITKDDMKNGDGLRVVLWVSGCPHHCKGCHNPITWDPDDGIIFDNAAKEELFKELDKDYISGITFSGGDPLAPYNAKYIGELITEIRDKYPNKTIWVYTGFTIEELLNKIHPTFIEILSKINVLVDGRFILDKKDNTLMWKGSSNQRVIDVPKTLYNYFHDVGSSVDEFVKILLDNKFKEEYIVLHCKDHEKDPINTNKCKGCGE